MKRLTTVCILLLISLCTFGHSWEPKCGNTTSFTFEGTLGPAGMAHIEVIDALGVAIPGGYSLDTLLSAGVTFQIKMPRIGSATVIARIYWSDGTGYTATSNNTVCPTTLPIKLVNVDAQTDGDYITVKFTALEEINVKYYKISISTDNGITWIDKRIEFTGTTPKGNYIVKFKK